MGNIARSFLSAIVFSISAVIFGWAGPIEDFKTAASALDGGDYATALRLFRTLAAQGIPGAKWALGTMYFEGKGVPRDYVAALAWHRQAADLGHPLSQYEIGVMYDRGLGVSKNPIEAAKWFSRAAEQGFGTAQVNLGAMYAVGEGVPKDNVQAYKWFSIAAIGGGYLDTQRNEQVKSEAAKRRDAIARQLTPSQLADAQRLERDWKAKPEPLPPANAAALAEAASRSPTVGQSARADCADLNRQAIPNNAALEAATEEYKKSVAFHLRETLDDSPAINVISAGAAAITKMLTAMDKVIDYLHSVQDGGCFGKDATAWAAAIRQFETQRDDMRKDRKTYIDILSMMAKGEEKPRPRQK